MIYNIETVGSQLGAQIFKARDAKGWTQKELAKRCFLSEDSRQTVAAWEKGKKLPSFEQILELCNIFDCEITHLLGDDCTTRDLQFIHDTTGLSEPAIKRLAEFDKKTVDGSAKATLINSMLEDEQFLTEAANILYALHMVPKKSIFEITFFDESNAPAKSSLVSDNSNDLRRLYMADLQNIIFTFLSTQFQK